MIKKVLILILLIGLASHLYAQDRLHQIDSIKNLINTTNNDIKNIDHYLVIAKLYKSPNPEKTIYYARLALNLSKQNSYQKGIDKAYIELFNGHFYTTENADSLSYYLNLLEKSAKTDNASSELKARFHFLQGIYYHQRGNLDKAYENYLAILDIHKKTPLENAFIAEVYKNIGGIHIGLGKIEETLKHLHKALSLDPNNGIFYENAGLIYQNFIGHIDSTNFYLNEAIRLHKKNNIEEGIARVFLFQAEYKSKTGQYDEAKKLFDQALEIAKKQNNNKLLLKVYRGLFAFYFDIERYSKAIEYGEQVINISRIRGKRTNLESIYEILYLAHANNGNYQKAYEVSLESMAFKDSTKNIELLNTIEELKTKYEVEQKENENQVLKKNLQIRNITAVALLLGLLLAVSLGLIIYRSNIQKSKYNRILEDTVAERTHELRAANSRLQQANYELKTFNYIASHDIKEPIRNIGSYVGLIFRKLPNDLKVSLGDYFSTIKRSSSQLYTLIEDFAKYTQLSQGTTTELSPVNLNELMESLEYGLQSTIERYNGKIIYDYLPTILSSRSLLFFALKNLVENGLKYNQSAVPMVNVSYSETPMHHKIKVSDNGIGIEKEFHGKIFEMFKRLHNRGEYEGSGVGLAIVKLVIGKLEGEILVNSTIEKGSEFVLVIPKKEFLNLGIGHL